MDEDRLQKEAQTKISSDTHCPKKIPFLRRQSGEGKEAEVDHIARVRDVKEGVALPLVWENPDARS